MMNKAEPSRVLFIDSYHAGYEWSDGITAAIEQTLEDENIVLRIHRMDTKNNTSEEFKQRAGLLAKAVLEEFNPDLVIATDDNAQKYLIAPYFRNSDLPVVFAGVNWDASVYGFPASNVTGMIEVSAVPEMLGLIRRITPGQRVGSINGNTETYRKEIKNYTDVLDLQFDEDRRVSTFDEWKAAFLEMQDSVDILYMYNNAGISDWDDAAANRFVLENARIPSGSVQPWMAPYVLVTFTKDPYEQGEYAARTALRILDGESPADIPLVTNQRGKVLLNSELARALGLSIPAEMLATADVLTN
jgi:ABC-type uncharacterized transport system substrate-binding protein